MVIKEQLIATADKRKKALSKQAGNEKITVETARKTRKQLKRVQRRLAGLAAKGKTAKAKKE